MNRQLVLSNEQTVKLRELRKILENSLSSAEAKGLKHIVAHSPEPRSCAECNFGCTGKCVGGCSGNCNTSCSAECASNCYWTCRNTCRGTCNGDFIN